MRKIEKLIRKIGMIKKTKKYGEKGICREVGKEENQFIYGTQKKYVN